MKRAQEVTKRAEKRLTEERMHSQRVHLRYFSRRRETVRHSGMRHREEKGDFEVLLNLLRECQPLNYQSLLAMALPQQGVVPKAVELQSLVLLDSGVGVAPLPMVFPRQ